jgi:periplasmic protein TonB
MFDLVAGNVKRPLQERTFAPAAVSMAGHALVALLVVVPVLYLTNQVPPVPAMLAFVAETPPLPPPPMPLPASALPRPAAPAANRPLVQATQAKTSATSPPLVAQPQAPIDAPAAIVQENDVPDTVTSVGGEGGGAGPGGPGGGEGGILAGDAGSLVGSKLVAETPAAPPAPRPVRIGGLIKPPDVIQQVQPKYPHVAIAAQVEGIVILEATVGADGRVASVRVLASASPLLDAPAVDAVRQWHYAPLLLDGTPVPFILTVTLNFSLQRKP